MISARWWPGKNLIFFLCLMGFSLVLSGCFKDAQVQSSLGQVISSGPIFPGNKTTENFLIRDFSEAPIVTGTCGDMVTSLEYSEDNLIWNDFNTAILAGGDDIDCNDNYFSLTLDGDFNGNDWSVYFSVGTPGTKDFYLRGVTTVFGPTAAARVQVRYDPNAVEITGQSPGPGSYRVISTAIQSLSVTAAGTGLSYQWRLNGSVIGGATLSTFDFDANVHAAGTYNVEVTATDAASNTDTATWTLVRNAPPTISAFSPLGSVIKQNIDSSNAFSVTASDANGDSISYTWRINGNTSSGAFISLTGPNASVGASGNNSFLGDNALSVEVSDGYESTIRSWTVNINGFHDSCNSLAPGHICTLTGNIGVGDNSLLTTAAGRASVRIQPASIAKHPDGLFISDWQSHVVWFWNYSASSVSVLGQTIDSQHIRVVAGNGTRGISSTQGLNAKEFKLNSPTGMAWDAVTQSLFIADKDNNRIVRVTSTGLADKVMCNGLATNNGTNNLGTDPMSHSCPRPWGLALDEASRTLFITNYGTGGAASIKALDISNASSTSWTASLFAGRAPTGTIDPGHDDGVYDPTNAASARLLSPTSIAIGPDQNIYFTTQNGCYLRVINRSGGSVSYFNGYASAADGEMRSIAGNTTCTAATENLSMGSVLFPTPTGLAIHHDGANVTGFFVSTHNNSRLLYLNNTLSNTTLGGRLIEASAGRIVMGTGMSGFNGDGLTGMSTQIGTFNPAVGGINFNSFGLLFDSANNALFFADHGNFRLRSLDLSVPSGLVQTHAGEQQIRGDTPVGTLARDIKYSSARKLAYDASRNRLAVNDNSNIDIDSVDLLSGTANSYVQGIFGATTEDANPLAATARLIDALVFAGPNLLFTESNNSGSPHCIARVWNSNAVTTTFWNISILQNTISTVLGAANLACSLYLSAGAPAAGNTFNRLTGIDVDANGKLLVTNFTDSCIISVDTGGDSQPLYGECGTSGAVDGSLGVGTTARIRQPTELVKDPLFPNNFFFIEDMNMGTSYISYINQEVSTAVTINSVSVGAQTGRRLFGTAGYVRSLAVYDDQICVGSGEGPSGSHNIICYNRNTGNISLRVGNLSTAVTRGGAQLGNEFEGVPASTALIIDPLGLAFDAEGNLYISEFSGHRIRKVQRWY